MFLTQRRYDIQRHLGAETVQEKKKKKPTHSSTYSSVLEHYNNEIREAGRRKIL